jgi:stearoyl-CoA desaturase (Delta-9 desaturase)
MSSSVSSPAPQEALPAGVTADADQALAEQAPAVGGRSTIFEHVFNMAGMAAIHFGAVMALVMGARPVDVAICLGLYLLRMFAITAGYHRYFAHRAFKTSRAFQFILALVGTTAVQKGPLWWAAIHRKHHRESDKPDDVHSAVQRGFWWSHIGWVLARDHEQYDEKRVQDLAKYPELRWLDRWHVVPVLTYLALTVAFGGMRGLCWWFCASTILVMHCTFAINSLTHMWGHRRFATPDDSRNNPILALVTLGEGWHNNHHRYMHSANQGFYWWQYDISYYLLRVLSVFGIVRELRTPPKRILEEGMRPNPAPYVKVEAKRPAPVRKPLLELPSMMPNPADAE